MGPSVVEFHVRKIVSMLPKMLGVPIKTYREDYEGKRHNASKVVSVFDATPFEYFTKSPNSTGGATNFKQKFGKEKIEEF